MKFTFSFILIIYLFIIPREKNFSYEEEKKIVDKNFQNSLIEMK